MSATALRRAAQVVLLTLACALPPAAQADSPQRHQDNAATAVIEQDGGRAFDFEFEVLTQRGTRDVDNFNAANAGARCTGCRATAIAFQIVLVSGMPERLTPHNRAVAVNDQCTECVVVAEARQYGAHVEGEIESITGVEDGVGSDTEAARQSLAVSLRFLEATGVDVFAPAIGNAHGVYKREPVLDFQRVSDLVAAHPIPIALHGGSGMTDAQFTDLIARGCAKVNISTALKITYMKSNLSFLTDAQARDKWDPPSLFQKVRTDIVNLTRGLAEQFGSAGKA